MVRMFVSGLSRLCLNPGWEHCFVFLGKTLNSHSASLHPGGVQKGMGKFDIGSNPGMD